MANTYPIKELNALSFEEAMVAFGTCCTSENWIKGMVNSRPYTDVKHIQKTASDIWWQLEEGDFLQAFDGHPKIGDVSSLRQKYANTKGLASNEQGGVSVASEATLQALAEGNHQYESKNGFIFIVFATGKTADEMLKILLSRLSNDRNTELNNAATEQSKITALRIAKMLGVV